MKKYDVIVIGGGVTGCSIVRDLKIRGFSVALLEKNKTICLETSLNNHRNLLSGLRYAVKDPDVAEQCYNENSIIKDIAHDLIEPKNNFFIVLNNQKDIEYSEKAIKNSNKIGIPLKEVQLNTVFKEIPDLNKDIYKVYETPDSNLNIAKYCKLCIKEVDDLYISCKRLEFSAYNGQIKKLRINNQEVFTDFVVNATGPWVNNVTSKLGITIPMVYNQGSIIVMKSRSPTSIQIMRNPQDGDAYIVHGSMALLGSTSLNIKNPDKLQDEPCLEQKLKNSFKDVIPKIVSDRVQHVIRAVRPLISNKNRSGRDISRSYDLIDHSEEGIDNFITIAGGKLTLARLMAEETTDLICKKVGSHAKCQTHIKKL